MFIAFKPTWTAIAIACVIAAALGAIYEKYKDCADALLKAPSQ